jgi:hypothetical protein
MGWKKALAIAPLLTIGDTPNQYERDVLFALGGTDHTLLSPNRMTVNINSKGYILLSQISLNLNTAATWDTQTPTDYTVAANRAGNDFYLYACRPVSGSTPVILVSANTSAPSGYTTSNSRQIGGFHCLCASMSAPGAWQAQAHKLTGTMIVNGNYWYRNVAIYTSAPFYGMTGTSAPTFPTTIGSTVTDGTVTWLCESPHSLSGFVAGDILPASIWDVRHRPVCNPQGMAYDSKSNVWADIYLMNSAANGGLSSTNNGTLPSQPIWNDCVDWAGSMSKRLPYDPEFQLFATGSPEMTNISTGAAPSTTGGYIDNSASSGASVSAAAPSTDIHAATSPTFKIQVDGDTTAHNITMTPAGLTTGAAIASAAQGLIQALGNQSGYVYTNVTVDYGVSVANKYTFKSGKTGTASAVVITAGATNDVTAALKIGITNSGVESTGCAARRIVSWIGLEDCTGVMVQWLLDQASINELNGTTTDANSLPGGYTSTVYYVASPSSAPIYMKYDVSGNPYFCCAAANSANARISFGSGTASIVGVIFEIQYDVAAASGGYQVYYNSGATSPMKWLANLSSPGYATSAFIATVNPQFFMRCIHDSSASSHGYALYWNSSNSHLECATASGVNDTFSPAAITNAFYWTSSVNQILPGNKGQLYEQGAGGSDVKLVAGGDYSHGVNAGTRSRILWYSRMDVFTDQAARFVCPPKGAV